MEKIVLVAFMMKWKNTENFQYLRKKIFDVNDLRGSHYEFWLTVLLYKCYRMW